MINNDIAIIGIDSHFGQYKNIDQVERALYLANTYKCEEPVADPNLQKILVPVQQLVLQSVERMAQANALKVSDITLVVICETPLDNFNESKQDSEVFDHVFNNLAEALSLIEILIEQDHKVALIGVNAVDQSAQQSSENNTLSFDSRFNRYTNSNGLAALLLCSKVLATENKLAIYASINSFSVANNKSVQGLSSHDITQVSEDALTLANIKATDVGLVECSALAKTELSETEALGLCQSYSTNLTREGNVNSANAINLNAMNLNDNKLNTAITSARSIVGEGAGFSQVLGLLRTVISLQQRYIPAIRDWQSPTDAQLFLWQQSNFYFPTEARPWYPNDNGSAHFAAYSCLTPDSYCHVILTEHRIESLSTALEDKFPKEDLRKNGFIASSSMKLLLVVGDSQTELMQNLEQLLSIASLKTAQQSPSLDKIAKQQYQNFLNQAKQFTMVLIAESVAELQKEISLAERGLELAFTNQSDWKTPKGSYFSAQPVTEINTKSTQNIGFMYPGIGATYVGLGRDLFHLFPEIYQGVASLADNIAQSLKDTLLNPRTIVRPSFKELKQLDLDLRGSLADIAEAGVGFACVFTQIFEDVFHVKADFATGYSMGEVSMYAALGCWQQPGLMSARLAQSTTFNNRLCGDLDTLRECWDLSAEEISADQLAISKQIWETYTIKATLAEFEQASRDEKRVYCTIVNTPDSLLLGGYPSDCLRVIDKLGVRAMPLNMANAIHSAPAKTEYDDMVSLYTMNVNQRIHTKMYSSSCYLPVPQFSGSIAHSIAKCLCEQVDFPRLVNTLYDKGTRIFIEMGPGRSLSSWVDKILPQTAKPHVSVPVNAKGTTDEITYFRAIAKLLSHGVKLELDSLFNGSIVIYKNK